MEDQIFDTGVLQEITYGATSLSIKDKIYGNHSLDHETEKLLVKILKSYGMDRHHDLFQHGVPSLLGYCPLVTRYEHAVGTFKIVHKAGGSYDEQTAALLHDISHPSFSQAVDYALCEPGESFHVKKRYRSCLDTMTDRCLDDVFPRLIVDEDHEEKLYDPTLWPLVERPAPHLSAHRLDCALRDGVVFGKLSREDAAKIYESVTMYSDAESPDRTLALKDPQLGLMLARAYLALDEAVWSNPFYLDIHRRVAKVIPGLLCCKREHREKVFYEDHDVLLWKSMARRPYDQGRTIIKELAAEARRHAEAKKSSDDESEYMLPETGNLRLPKRAEIHTIDPEIVVEGKAPQPLSELIPEWGRERQEYIERRERERETDEEEAIFEARQKAKFEDKEEVKE